ncbi:MAG: Hydroxyacylglutathione hydrolase [Candidatus Magnetoglobus multicellularis str. Araruama]|uniref:hydroxyacylglutathione hydrolase n=1 Tax=Candidatus Magnetoglobus multicellularis str. Araruama TaxID=890399 RepID=A0A1V1PHK1_9BACT|nr:MAG: Hydroxyacylglutathione hydrolase [Candidatus Magnetoglobus multicellularis str. Araruama]
MIIKQFRYHNDNLAYVVHGETQAIAIDGGAVSEILSYLKKHHLNLKYVCNTHSHGDHTSGNRQLLKATGATFVSIATLLSKNSWQIDNTLIKIYNTPGHSYDSVCFHINDWLISGDTLFNGTVGNCFTNDETSFVNSLKKIVALPDETIIYAGHDYAKPAMKFAKKLALNLPAVDAFLKTYNPQHVFSTLAQEKSHNIFLQLNTSEITDLLQSKGLPIDNEAQRFRCLKEIEIWD